MRYYIPRFQGEESVDPDRIEKTLELWGASSIRWHRPSGTVRFSHCNGDDYEGAVELDDLQRALGLLHPNCKYRPVK